MNNINQILAEGLSSLKINIPAEAAEKLVAYFALLRRKNEVMNLISPKQDVGTQVIVHLVDSLAPLLWPELPAGPLKALDFGAGGGLPGLPLAIARPGWAFTLAEATAKKAAFLEEVKGALALENVAVLNAFLEPNKNPQGHVYDLITARAVTALQGLADIAGPRLGPGGLFLAYKGPRGDEEMAAAASRLHKRHLRLKERLEFRLPVVAAERRLFIFQK